MIPFKSPLLLTVPPTLEKRLEALAALRTLLAQDEALYQQRRAEIAALRRDFDRVRPRLEALIREFETARPELQRILKYNPDEPRVPAGQHGGGQWTKEGESTADPRVAQILPPPLLFEDPLFVRPPLAEFPKDPKLPPGPDFEWRGQPGSQPGDPDGSWYNPKTDESLHPDMNHGPPDGPHYDYKAPDGQQYRWFPDGRLEPKKS
jgi:hypothetical protein